MAAVGCRQLLLPVLVVLLCLAGASSATNVTYDHRALVIDGVRRVLVSGSIHYPRSTPDVRPRRSFLSVFPRTLLLLSGHPPLFLFGAWSELMALTSKPWTRRLLLVCRCGRG